MFMKTSKKIKIYLTTNQPKGWKYYNNANSLVVDKIKDETCGYPIKGFVGLKSKWLLSWRRAIMILKTQKNIRKYFIDDELKYEDYKNVLFNRFYMRHEINKIHSKDHNIKLLCK